MLDRAGRLTPGGLASAIPLATLLDLAERPGEMAGLGPVDPALARDLAHAAAANPQTTYCVTVTDQHGHAIGHGCARPAPRNHTRTTGHDPPAPHDPPGGHDPPGDHTRTAGHDPPCPHDPPGDHDPPGGPGTGLRPGFTFTASGEDGPPGGYGAWRLSTGVAGRPDLLVAFDRSPSTAVITGWRAAVMIRGSSSGTWPRSGTLPASGRRAGGLLSSATSSIISRTRRAAGRACVMARLPAVTSTGSSRTRAGKWSRSPREPSAGPPHRAGSTAQNQPAIPSEQRTESHGPGAE